MSEGRNKRRGEVGTEYGKLKFTGEELVINGRYHGVFICKCGAIVTKSMTRVLAGRVMSCGCLARENQFRKHGMTGTKEYRAWTGLKNRATNPNSKDYHRYGALEHDRDLLNNFEVFYAAIGPCPSPKHSVDRIDTTKGYQKTNIRWATDSEQQRNRRDSKRVIIKGLEFDCKADAAVYFGVTKATVSRWELGSKGKKTKSISRGKPWIKTYPKYNNVQMNG